MSADIIITEFLDKDAEQYLRDKTSVLRDDQLAFEPERLYSLTGAARALIVRNRTCVDKALLDAAPHVKVIGRLGVGLDNIDMASCAERNIKVIPAIGANSDSVAEYVITAMLVMMRPIWNAATAMTEGAFPRQPMGQGCEIGGKTLALIGFGGIGRNVAHRAAAMGMHIMAYDPSFKPEPELNVVEASLPECLAAADAVSLHIPLNDATKHLMNADALEQMKQGAVLINTARGGIIDHMALADRLASGHIGGAAIDVFEDEPPAEGALAMFKELDNIWLTPHIAGVTQEATRRVSWMTVEAVARHLF
ncbi:MAG: hypothetical protein CBC12_12220 [Candidatus Puniceispirillum sp. TMED52]|nr:3-phosphoglycerate dehydrogenase [SAR116 cluster bacterium]OUU45985.1 MAG: hypothetical protein CBC12_12220 [Candidatus Puniceispirillum sp. TMED52]HCP17943.1 3-phosphoglycerate dehydrogenase [Alphaproteobacteria bacterium]